MRRAHVVSSSSPDATPYDSAGSSESTSVRRIEMRTIFVGCDSGEPRPAAGARASTAAPARTDAQSTPDPAADRPRITLTTLLDGSIRRRRLRGYEPGAAALRPTDPSRRGASSSTRGLDRGATGRARP